MADYYDASEVKQAVSGQIEDIVKSLLPAAKREGHELRIGSLTGDKGRSLGISLRPDKFGQWGDLSSGESGDIISLVMAVQGVDYKDALGWLASMTSVQPQIRQNISPMRASKLTEIRLEDHTVPLTRELADYSIGHRKVSLETLNNYSVMSGNTSADEMAFITWYEGKCVKVHYSDVNTKEFRSTKDPFHTLWGKRYATPDRCRGILTITEGQWDALSYAELGIPAVSIPSGVSNMKWIDNDYDYLSQFHTFHISFDMDEQGQKALEKVLKRLGYSKCNIVKLPRKDASDMLQKGESQLLLDAHRAARPEQPQEIICASDIIDEAMVDYITDPKLLGDPFYLPMDFRVRDHEMTLIFGQKGHGKSQCVLNQMAFEICQGNMVMIASFESMAKTILNDLVRQCSGVQRDADPEFMKKVYIYVASHVIIYDSVNKPSPKKIIDAFTYAHKRFGVKRFVLDNITTMKVKRGDYDAQAEAADDLRCFTKEYPVHLFAVAHSRKSDKTGYDTVPHENDIRGAGEWGDLAENIIAVWRNKLKAESIHELIKNNRHQHEIDAVANSIEDGKIVVRKQRNGDDCFLDVWFDKNLKIFSDHPNETRCIKKLMLRGVIKMNNND